MIEPGRKALDDALRRWRFFEECLLHDLRLAKYGFEIDLVFNYVWSDDQVKPDVLENPNLIELRLLGVESLHLTGGLTRGMIEEPDLINWGLSEVARVEQAETATGLGLSVRWEGERRIDVAFWSFEVNELGQE